MPTASNVISSAGSRRRLTSADLIAFIEQHTELGVAALVPEVRLHLARDARHIFEAAEELVDGARGSQPYWAFAWPGGQALARYILDHPELVAGKRVLDLGAGSGLGAIAAAKAGARFVRCSDIDPLAVTVCRMNGDANAVVLDVTPLDLLGEPPDADVVLIGDLVYEPDLKTRVGLLLDAARAREIPVLYGDRTTARRPRQDFRMLEEYEAPLTPALVDDFIERARVWSL